MDDECEGSGREVLGDPPPDEAMTCPACGRETKVEVQDTNDGLNITIAPHQKVVQGSR